MCFSPYPFSRLINAQRHYVEIFDNEFDANLTSNMTAQAEIRLRI